MLESGAVVNSVSATAAVLLVKHEFVVIDRLNQLILIAIDALDLPGVEVLGRLRGGLRLGFYLVDITV